VAQQEEHPQYHLLEDPGDQDKVNTIKIKWVILMVMKNRLLLVFFISLIFIGAVFAVVSIAYTPSKHMTLDGGWNVILITENMILGTPSIYDMSENCGRGKRGRITDGWTYDLSEGWSYVVGNDLTYKPRDEDITKLDKNLIGQPLWLYVEGSESCKLSCGGAGCLDCTADAKAGKCQAPTIEVVKDSTSIRYDVGEVDGAKKYTLNWCEYEDYWDEDNGWWDLVETECYEETVKPGSHTQEDLEQDTIYSFKVHVSQSDEELCVSPGEYSGKAYGWTTG